MGRFYGHRGRFNRIMNNKHKIAKARGMTYREYTRNPSPKSDDDPLATIIAVLFIIFLVITIIT